MIGLGNNAAERALRRPVVTRKNAYGSRTENKRRPARLTDTVTPPAAMPAHDFRILTSRQPQRHQSRRLTRSAAHAE